MRCVVCERVSLSLICRRCRSDLLSPSLATRTLECGVAVTSFFPYTEIQTLLTTKHTVTGHGIYSLLAAQTMAPLGKAYTHPGILHAVAIDDHVGSGYAHTAILAHALSSASVRPVYGALRASNPVSYAGQTLDFRRAHPRGFAYTGPRDADVVLVDDIVTTGTTIAEAAQAVRAAGSRVVAALVIADAAR